MKGTLIIHHIRDNKQGFMAGVTFHAIHQAKSNRPFVRPTAPDFLLDNEVGRLYETDLGDASTSEERSLRHDTGCGPLLRIVLFAFCAIATATPVLDTPEVAQAKAAHLATQAYEAARNTIGYGWPGYGWSGYGWPALYAPAIAYGAPIGADGRVVDTPEVAQAKAAHLAAHAQNIAANITTCIFNDGLSSIMEIMQVLSLIARRVKFAERSLTNATKNARRASTSFRKEEKETNINVER
ncbi:hypothetical protein ALC56_00850 [Trachymyrmex septentrionalis]|uniref:Uncharacterized protein n=1 Tax=Trachymyrmex septentrionalis TaxID=34720 RepID=A0A195FYE2_9HYME|nr:hypothetical protein ALC56_00850 [Trachymyrmex septentrionalis]